MSPKNKSEISKDSSKELEIDRRSFLRKLGLGTLGLGALSLLPGASALRFNSQEFQIFTSSSGDSSDLENNLTVAKNGSINVHNNNLLNVSKINGTAVSKLENKILNYTTTEINNNLSAEIDYIISRPMLLNTMTKSSEAMETIASSQTAMDSFASSTRALDSVSVTGTKNSGFEEISSSDMAMSKFLAGVAGLSPANYGGMSALCSSSAAMDAVSSTQRAREAANNSEAAKNGILASDEFARAKFLAGSAMLNPGSYSSLDTVAGDIDFSSGPVIKELFSNEITMDILSSSQVAMDSLFDTSDNRMSTNPPYINFGAEYNGSHETNKAVFKVLAPGGRLEFDYEVTSANQENKTNALEVRVNGATRYENTIGNHKGNYSVSGSDGVLLSAGDQVEIVARTKQRDYSAQSETTTLYGKIDVSTMKIE